jgi:hypothetical protein
MLVKGQRGVMGQGRVTDALLTRMSSLPPVRLETASWQALMLSSLVTSRARAVMPTAAISASTAGLRAVAMTCTPGECQDCGLRCMRAESGLPLAWNSMHSAWPMPPGVQLRIHEVSAKSSIAPRATVDGKRTR